MKRLLKKLSIFFMALSTMHITACQSQRSGPDLIPAMLEEKYGEPFTIEKIGDRFLSGSVTAYCHADSNSSFSFIARYFPQDRSLYDEYADRLINKQLEATIAASFQAQGIEAAAFSRYYGETETPNDSAMKLATFIHTCQPSGFTAYIAIPETVSNLKESTAIMSALENVSNKLRIPLRCQIEIIPLAAFEACKQWLASTPVYYQTQIEETYGAFESFLVLVTDSKAERVSTF